MDFIELIKAALFGLVEGITEWLPVSSTGHMILLDNFVKLNQPKDFWDMFLVVIQLGAILAVCVMFAGKLNPLSPSKDADERSDTWKLWAKVIVACLPAAVIGIPLDDWMEEHLGSPYVIAAALVVYGIIFIVMETVRERRARELAIGGTVASTSAGYHGAHFATKLPATDGMGDAELADVYADCQTVDDIDWKRAIGIGLFQVLSMVPGTSRSGSTIIGGLLLGCSRTAAAEFTFFLAIPVMVGASGLRLVKFFLKGNTFTGEQTAILLVGCAVAFVVSMLSIRFLMDFVKKHDFKPFGVYRIVLGVAVALYFFLH